MIESVAALGAVLILAAAGPSDAPRAPAKRLVSPALGSAALAAGPESPRSWEGGAPRLMTLSDAPTTPSQSFAASGLTALTGLGILVGLAAGPRPGLPMSDFSLHARIAASLLLLNVGPSVGDFMNHDIGGFLAGAGGRSLLTALGWGAVSLAGTSGDPVIGAMSLLFVTLGALVWVGWSATDLARSAFAPERWVDRQNQGLLRARVGGSTSPPDVDRRRTRF